MSPQRRVQTLALLVVGAAVLHLYGAALTQQAFQTHEALHPYARVRQLLAEIARGHVPQSFPDAVDGLGSAFPRYYPPVPYGAATALAAALHSPELGVNLASFLAALLSGFATYAALHAVTRDPWLSVGGALLAISAPYRLAQVFVRGALAESWSLVFYPLALLGAWRALASGRPAWHLPLAVAGVLLSHQITLLYALPLFVVLAFLSWRAHGSEALRRLVAFAAMGFGFALFFLLPQQAGLTALRATDAALMGATPSAVAAHRVRPAQLVETPRPDRWWGVSRPEPEPDGMSFAPGWATLLALPLALAVGLRRRTTARGQRPFALALLGFSALALCFVIAPGPWLSFLPGAFGYVQFPWRLLGLVGLCSAMAVPILVEALGFGRPARIATAALGLAAVVSVPAFERQPLVSDARSVDALGLTVQGEYLPKAFDPGAPRPGVPTIVGGRVLGWSRNGADMTVRLEAPRGGELHLPLFYYDFYRARDAANRVLPTNEAGAWLAVEVPPDATEVRIDQRLTTPARIGLALSLVTLAVWLYVISRP